MTEAAIALRGPSAAMNPWLVAAAVVVPTFMEVLDTTIAVVALRYIAGGLSATVNDGEWVLMSYLAANAIILPITGWLSNRFGRRNYFLASIAVFTVASGLCGMATSLSQRILAGPASIPIWVQCAAVGTGPVAGGFFCRPYASGRGLPAWSADRCAAVDADRPAPHGGRQLLDVAA
jgi:MFS family permease